MSVSVEISSGDAPVVKAETLDGFPLSPQQERLFQLITAGGADVYRAQLGVELEGRLEVALLRWALDRAVARHEILRSTFQFLPGMSLPLQVVAESGAVSFAVLDIKGVPAAEQEISIAAIADATWRSPRDLSRDPALEVSLIALAPERHYLLVTASALHADGIALQNLLREVGLLYSKPGSELGAALQYPDLSAWQNEILREKAGADFWRARRFADPRRLRLSVHGAPPVTPDLRRVPVSLPADVRAAIALRTKEWGAAPSDLFLAAWEILLARLTGSPDLVIGISFDGRHYEGLAEAVGPLARWLPVRFSPVPRITLEEAVREARQAVSEIRGWQEYFSWTACAVAEGEGGAPYFPFCFAWEGERLLVHVGESIWRPAGELLFLERFDLQLSLRQVEGKLEADIRYDAARFTEDEARAITGRLERLLAGGLQSPGTAWFDLEILSEDERRWLLYDLNRTQADFPADRCLHELISEQARRSPAAVAVISARTILTYAELDRRADALAGHLRLLGVGPEVLVGIYLGRSADLIVALLAVWKAGGAYLPLDPGQPRERLAFLLAETSTRVLISQGELLPGLPEHGARVVLLDSGAVFSSRPLSQEGGARPESLAYVIYTSGSTGRPKGVMVAHRGLVNYLHWGTQAYGVKEGEGAPVHSPLSFDLTITSLFSPLLAGRATVLLPEDHGVLSLQAALQSGCDWSFVKLTPAHLELINLELAAGGTVGGSRALILGGEALRAETLAPWRTAFPGTRLINEYGPTETVVGCCVYEVPVGFVTSGMTPIGRPIANTRLYLLDSRQGPVPPGMPGELWVGGEGVARGYFGRPDLTAERFIPDPWGGELGGRMYRTGDLVRYLPDGNLEFLGRVDRQVKIRGFRVELGEIEVVLGSHAGVREVVVETYAGAAGDVLLVAYLALRREEPPPPAISELRSFLGARLPDYMIPAAWVFLDALPLTVNGKVDRAALPAPGSKAGQEERGYVPPSAPVDELLAGIWAEVLHRARVGMTDNFFDLGGHSLLATQVMSRVKDSLGVDLPLRSLFDAPILAAFGDRVEAARRAGELQAPPIASVPRDGALPVSFAQQRLLFLEALAPGTSLYHIPIATRIEGRLDFSVLARSFTELVRRHEILRTSFETVEGHWMQLIAPPQELLPGSVDLAGLTAGERERESARLVAQDAQRIFDLARGPLLRVTVLRLAPEEHLVLVTLHHAVADGWSIGVLVKELAAIVSAYSQNELPTLPELRFQYADFASWQRQWLSGAMLTEQLAYWRRQSGPSLTALELPTDRPRSAIRSWRGEVVRMRFDAALADGLRALSRQHGTTLFMTLLAAFDTILARYSGQDEVVVGSPIANRTRAEWEKLIGFFVNTLALRGDLRGDLSFLNLMDRVREVALGAYEHQDLPYEMLVEDLHAERDLSRTPVFQVLFVLQNAPAEVLELPGLRLSVVNVGTGASKFDWTLSLNETADGLDGWIEYASDLFDAGTLDRFTGHLEILLGGLLENPDRRLSDLPLLSIGERAELLAVTPIVPVPTDEGLAQRFESAVDRFPEAVALVHEGELLTYRELDERANQVAHRLMRLGMDPMTGVALCLERSIEMVIGILGILKARGAYIPLDPDYPRERLALMLEDSRAPFLLTRERLVERLSGSSAQILDLDSAMREPDAASRRRPSLQSVAEDAAYVIYTSGSTGKPKGVMVTHANVLRLFAATAASFGFTERDVWTLFHSVAFDFSVWEMWGALLHGGRLVVVPYLTSRSPEAFHGLLGAEGVTVLSQTPSAFRQLIRAEEELHAAGTLDLSWVVFGGEALDLQSLAPWFARHDDQHPRLVNMYGITETTVHVTYREISKTDLACPGSPLGRPIDDLRIVLLDRHLQLVPVGVHGEIHVGGAGLARGYLGRPALTAERFVPDPWSPGPGGRLYRTGDLARRVPSGDLLYLGRRDHQVKIRGFRLEPGEIEAALMSHPAIRQAVVVAREEDGERRLVSYLVPRDAGEPGPEELRAHLRSQLPEHAVPAAFVFLPELPLTPSGKVDRRALPVPQSTRSGLTTAYREPRTVVERVLARIWAHALGLPRVGIHDNFFALGGDSIRSIGILSAARDQGLAISLQQIFLHQTIAELAPEARPEVERDRVHLQPFALLTAEDQARLPAGLDDAYPLSRLQAGMLFHMTAMPGSAAYHNVNSHHLSGRFVPESFAVALGQVIERHPVLRTSFDLGTFSEPMQLVHRTADVPFAVEDWTLLDPEAQEQALVELVERERIGRFDPLRAPQIRFHVVRRGPRDFQLTVTENHAILDGWSLHAALTEIFDRYLAILDGKPTDSESPPAATMRDFVYLERLALESVEARKFWAATLEGVTATALPRWSGGQSEVFGQRVRDHGVGIAPGAFERLHALAIARGVPLKSLLLAAHVKALSLLTGRMDVVTGLTSHGRIEGEGGEKALGLFLNTLPFRLRLASGSWLDLARQVFAAEQAMLPFRRFPLAELQRLEGGAALFDTQFNFVHFHIVGEILRSGRLEVLGARKAEETNLALLVGFSADPATSRLGLELNWDSAQFSRTEVESIGALFARVLEAMAADPEARHEGSSWSTAAGRQQILREWNDTTANENAGACVHELVLARARLEPSALAVAHADGRMTYGELAARASSLTDALRAIGVGPETVVAIAIESPPERIVGLLGILVAGGAYLPLDLAYPPERLTYMLDDARPRVLLTEDTLRDRLPATKVPVLCLNADRERSTRWDSEPPAVAVSADNLAYVIYTSGSTGRPKGVEVPHRGLLNLIHWHLETYSVGPDDRATQMAAPSFDAAVWEIWPYLAAGASLWFPEPETRSSPPLLTEWLVERSITLSFLPTPLAEAMLDARWPEELALRNLLTGGDRLRRLPAEAPPFRLINHYGPTESSVVTTMTPVSLPAAPGASAPPIGRPITGLRVYLLDEAAQPAAIGVPGELHIAGVGLARGYRDRPDWTAERFVPDPFALRRGGRLYRTGDLGRYLPDGQIEFIGRRDEQVKIRGFRIELAEIEVALLAFPGVRQAGVLAHEDDAGRTRLVAYWVPTEPPGPTTEELRLGLQRTLPAPMVPALFVALDELPLSPNGKLDRRALPAPVTVVPQAGADLPQDETEERLAVLWAEVLGIERVGIHDNFFELGGDSILSLQIVARAHRVGLWFHAGQIFEHPTVAELARVASRRSTADAEQGIVTGPVPLTPIQQWFFARQLPTPHHYNQAVLLEVGERLAPVLLDRVLAALTAHHDALRLRFERDEAEGTGWRQTLAALEFRPAFSLIDLSRLPASARGTSVEEAGTALELSLDLGAGPLARLALFDLGAAEAERLLFTCHHLVVDGVSWRLLLADVETAYRQLERGEAVDLGPKTTSFKRWAVRLAEHARSKAVREELGYWLEAERIALPKLPVDLTSPGENTESSVRFVSAALSIEETRVLLREVPEVYNTQINDVLLTALAFAFARWTDVPRLRVDVEGHGREEIADDLDLSRTVGWFTTLFPVVLDLRGVSGPGESLKAIKEQLRAIPARGLGYGLLRYLPDPEIGEGLSRSQPVEVSFNYLGQFDGVLAGSSPFRVARESAGLLHGPRQPRAHLLEVGASVEGGELQTAWEWSANIHRRETIESLAGSFIEALREIIQHCQSTQGDYTPSDFPDVERLDQERLEKIFDEMELS